MRTQAEYDERKAAKIERLRARAERKSQEAAALLKSGNAMFDCIPFGQPILVGHYSEGRDRRYRERAHNKISKGYATQDYAESLEERADNAEANTAIFSEIGRASC